uniref:Uncharacterized protein n=1 Tax=Steinernema glaseri TaxID=37863 RepID=A0A1I7YQ11_9BILA
MDHDKFLKDFPIYRTKLAKKTTSGQEDPLRDQKESLREFDERRRPATEMPHLRIRNKRSALLIGESQDVLCLQSLAGKRLCKDIKDTL